MSDIEEFEIISSGDYLNNEYIILFKIGAGSFASVWMACDKDCNKIFAIKVHNDEENDVAEKELQIHQMSNKRKNTVVNNLVDHFIHIDKDSKLEYLCLVYDLRGGNLYDIIKKGCYTHGLPINVVKNIFYQILVGLKELNDIGYYHTDIRPENILLCGYGLYTNIVKKIKNYNLKKRIADKINELVQNKHKLKKNVNINDVKNIAIKYVVENLIKSLDKDISEIKNKIEIDHICNKYISRNRACFYSEFNYGTLFNLNDIKIKLSDLGSCETLKTKNYKIQTRYYRCPEVILEYDMNEKCDIWSCACVLYELITGEMMFEPDKDENISRDRYHILDMIQLLGPIPNELLNKSKRKEAFFKSNNLLKYKNYINYFPLSKVLQVKTKSNPNFYDTEDFYMLCDLLYKMLSYDPKNRPSVNECLNHPWLKA